MTPKSIRLVYVCEYLLALIAIFTAWSEIGGQTALDVMPWGWKFGLGATLAAAIVAYSAAIASQDSLWTLRSARWLTTICVLLLAMSVVTYYYVLEDETVDTDDSGTALLFLSSPAAKRFLVSTVNKSPSLRAAVAGRFLRSTSVLVQFS